MTASSDFIVGFMCCGLVVLLYLLYELIELLREFVLILRESLEELRNE